MRSFDFKDVLSTLTHVRSGIPALRISSRVRLGEHKSVFFGQGDFFDIQEYDPERDNPNQIISSFIGPDEDVTYSRKCIELHEIKIIFLTDLSSSLDAGFGFIKRRLLLESIGFIGATGTRYQDPIGLVGFTDRVALNLPARCGSNNLYNLLKNVYDFLDRNNPEDKKLPRRKTDFFIGLDFIRRSFPRSCFVPVISDFVGFEKVVDSPLLRSVAAKHELIFIFLDDPLELTLARGPGYVRLENIENGKQSIVSRRKMFELERDLRSKRREIRNKLKKMGIYSVVLEYGENGRHFNRLHRFFLRRHKSINIRN
ncbi:MAG: hypothetical protein Q8Q89_04535 [bacterium]|nr:hypothetical protein [bacterium]